MGLTAMPSGVSQTGAVGGAGAGSSASNGRTPKYCSIGGWPRVIANSPDSKRSLRSVPLRTMWMSVDELRATGQAEGEKIKAEADRQRQITVAEAYRDAQRVKGEGDAQAAKIYADAFQRNAEFYAFYRSMEAYRQTMRNKSDLMVLDPSSDFFKYFKSPGRGK